MRRSAARTGRWRPALGRRPRLSGAGVLLDVGLASGVLVLLWVGLGLPLLAERDAARREAERSTANMAGAAEQVLARTVELVDQRLLLMRDAFRRDPGTFTLDFLHGRTDSSEDPVLQVGAIRPDGRLWLSSLGPVRGTVDLSDRAHFRVHLGNGPDRLFISGPVRGRESGRPSVQFSRRLPLPDGGFGGVVVASLDPNWLRQLYDVLDVGRGMMTLAGRDGVVRARVPERPGTLGATLPPAFVEQVFAAGQGTLEMASPIDGVRRIVSFRRLRTQPLLVLVGQDLDDVFATYRAHRRRVLLVGGAMTLLVLLLGVLLVVRRQRQHASQQAFTDAVENIDQGLLMVGRGGRVAVLNRRAAELLELPPGLPAARIAPEQVPGWSVLARAAQEPGSAGSLLQEHVRADGAVLEMRGRRLPDGRLVCTFADVTRRRQAEQRILFLAQHDGLTGLANRGLLRERLDAALAAARRGGPAVAVLALDLDRFKAVNDTLGHPVGDQLLVEVAARLTHLVREGDVAGRLGGDEFVLLQVGGVQPAAAEALAARVVAVLGETFALGPHNVRVGASVGIAVFPRDGADADTLLCHADAALYRVKRRCRPDGSPGEGRAGDFRPGPGEAAAHDDAEPAMTCLPAAMAPCPPPEPARLAHACP